MAATASTANRKLEVEKTFAQADFERFAKLSGDDNPIHVDAGFSAATRFGRPVAHGMLLYSVFRGMLHELVPGAVQQSQNLKFTAPTFAGEPMRFLLQVSAADSDAVTATMSCTRMADELVTCAGESTLRIVRP